MFVAVLVDVDVGVGACNETILPTDEIGVVGKPPFTPSDQMLTWSTVALLSGVVMLRLKAAAPPAARSASEVFCVTTTPPVLLYTTAHTAGALSVTESLLVNVPLNDSAVPLRIA